LAVSTGEKAVVNVLEQLHIVSMENVAPVAPKQEDVEALSSKNVQVVAELGKK
jgi:hypothetical protein